MTRDQARDYLTAHGYADEADKVLKEAQKFPTTYAYTRNRWAWAVYIMPGGHWKAGDSRDTEEAIAALRSGRHA